MKPNLVKYLRLAGEHGVFSEAARAYLQQFECDEDFLSQARIAVTASEDFKWSGEEIIEEQNRKKRRWWSKMRWWRTSAEQITTGKREERLLWLLRRFGTYDKRVIDHVVKYAMIDPSFAKQWAMTWWLHLGFNGPEPLDSEQFLRTSSD
jgi:hypothetical protein